MSSVLFHVMRGLEIGCWTPPLYFTRRTLLQIVDGASQGEAGRTQYRRRTGSFEKPYSMRGMRRAFPSLSTDCAGLRCFGGSQSYKKKILHRGVYVVLFTPAPAANVYPRLFCFLSLVARWGEEGSRRLPSVRLAGRGG